MIEVVPPETPVTIPVEVVTVAMEILPLVQVPPVVLLLKVILLPGQTGIEPVMGVSKFTLIVNVDVQPAGVV